MKSFFHFFFLCGNSIITLQFMLDIVGNLEVFNIPVEALMLWTVSNLCYLRYFWVSLHAAKKAKKEITFSLGIPDNDQGGYITIYGLQTGSVNDDIDNNYKPLPKHRHLKGLSDE